MFMLFWDIVSKEVCFCVLFVLGPLIYLLTHLAQGCKYSIYHIDSDGQIRITTQVTGTDQRGESEHFG